MAQTEMAMPEWRPSTSNRSPNQPSDKTPAANNSKPRRVRTGCLTCRERHLKCDEGTPTCQNCRKSSRTCRRGVRLNFIDTKIERPPTLLTPTHDYQISFQDNSREIASEYVGGSEQYSALLPPDRKRRRLTPAPDNQFDQGQHLDSQPFQRQQVLQPQYSSFPDPSNPLYTPQAQAFEDHTQVLQQQFNDQHRQSYDQSIMLQQEIEPPARPLSNREEVLYMQVFVEEVGLWMDSLNHGKYFSRSLPFQALREPMLKYALLACGARHLILVNPAYPEDHALNYYNQANHLLLESLQNPNRDTYLCATTATVLNVYEIMSEGPMQRMNHIAGARALIKECRWDGTTSGIGSACFWLNVGLELFSCLHFNWSVAWDPDTWGVNMNMNPQLVGGEEEEWTHKILWILAKIVNFRASAVGHADQMRIQQRLQQWLGLKQFCDRWDKCVPPTMHAMAAVPVYLTRSKSAFPEIWYIKRTTVVARLFWHTALCLLSQLHPMAAQNPQIEAEMTESGLDHARRICGTVAHVKDRGVASASIRCITTAAELLKDHREQEEVLEILERIKKEAGWRIAFINEELKEKWGWHDGTFAGNGQTAAFFQNGSIQIPTPAQPRPKPPGGIVNPLYKHADFGAPNPPYQGSYVPPAAGYLPHAGNGIFAFSGIPAM